MELGIGIHGEPGRERTKLKSADEIAEILTVAVVNDIPYKSGDEVLAFVNGMGGTPLIELYVIFNAVHRYLTGKGIKVTRSLVGNYITSLEMAGCSVTLLKLDAETTKLWDAPVHTAALRWKV
jgi:dihydroxyacetone kinase-like protein